MSEILECITEDKEIIKVFIPNPKLIELFLKAKKENK